MISALDDIGLKFKHEYKISAYEEKAQTVFSLDVGVVLLTS